MAIRRIRSIIVAFIAILVIIGLGFNSDIRDRLFGDGLIFNSDIKVFIFDVGQGDSILIKAFDRNILIDAGPDKNTVADRLKSFGVNSLNLIIVTHPHSDHIGGMLEVLKRYNVEYYLDPGIPHTSKTYRTLLDVVEEKRLKYIRPNGQSIHIQSAELFIFPIPDNPKDINNGSVVGRLSYKDFSALFLGDAEIEEQSFIIGRYSGRMKSNIVKVSHHGSSNGTNQRLLDTVVPEVAVISVGKGNSYGHPHRETLELLKRNNVKIYRTDRDGTVVILSDGNRYKIIRERGTVGERVMFIILQIREFISGGI